VWSAPSTLASSRHEADATIRPEHCTFKFVIIVLIKEETRDGNKYVPGIRTPRKGGPGIMRKRKMIILGLIISFVAFFGISCYAGSMDTEIGGTTFHSDGSTSTQIGNTMFNSDGSSSTRIGNTIFNSDGSSSQRIGNTMFNSDGSTSNQIGHTMFNSDGSTSTQIGNTRFNSDDSDTVRWR
jgi:hypothetical protein